MILDMLEAKNCFIERYIPGDKNLACMLLNPKAFMLSVHKGIQGICKDELLAILHPFAFSK